ncbi:hypothetical protein SH2C18_28160 [Clostridium sediminicola]|uniref:CPBP family glutamic-type intramembrane protease n=1 Tax=Clostridium sediminicola TaxID=3114879 RepID=UPI0031F24F83
MKYVKMILKIFAVLCMAFMLQIVVSFGYGVIYSIKALSQGMSQLELTENVQVAIMQNLDIITVISAMLSVLLIFLICLIRRKSFLTELKVNKLESRHIKYVVLIGCCAFMFSMGLASLLSLEKLDQNASESLSNLVTNGSFFITLLNVGIIVPICEEVLFRGYIFRKLYSTIGIKTAIILQALIFSLYHMNLVQALPTFILGVLAGIAVYYTNSLWGGIVIHAINNSIAVLLSHTLPQESDFNMIMSIIFIIIAFGLLILIIRKLKENKSEWISSNDRTKKEEIVFEG